MIPNSIGRSTDDMGHTLYVGYDTCDAMDLARHLLLTALTVRVRRRRRAARLASAAVALAHGGAGKK